MNGLYLQCEGQCEGVGETWKRPMLFPLNESMAPASSYEYKLTKQILKTEYPCYHLTV